MGCGLIERRHDHNSQKSMPRRSASSTVVPSRRWIGPILAVVSLLAGPQEAARAGTNVWTSIGPPGGYIRAIAIDPATPSTIYAGAFGPGIFKTSDGGSTWT